MEDRGDADDKRREAQEYLDAQMRIAKNMDDLEKAAFRSTIMLWALVGASVGAVVGFLVFIAME